MKNSETGEYELVVGNGQLLSAFFIVALLLGVAFGLGYMIGQNSQRSKPQTDILANSPPSVVVQTPARPAASSAAPEQPEPSSDLPADSATQPTPAAPQPTTQPARETPAAAAAKPAPPPAPDAPAGSYWQVAAFKAIDEAQPIIHTLKDGGMPVIAKSFPDGLVHVLVGPFADARALSNARQELTTRLGIKTVYPRQLPIK